MDESAFARANVKGNFLPPCGEGENIQAARQFITENYSPQRERESIIGVWSEILRARQEQHLADAAAA